MPSTWQSQSIYIHLDNRAKSQKQSFCSVHICYLSMAVHSKALILSTPRSPAKAFLLLPSCCCDPFTQQPSFQRPSERYSQGETEQRSASPHPSTRSPERSSPPSHLSRSYSISEQLSSLFETAYYQRRGSLTLFLFLAADSQCILRLVFLFTQYIQSSVTTCSNFLFLNRQDLALSGVTRGRAA